MLHEYRVLIFINIIFTIICDVQHVTVVRSVSYNEVSNVFQLMYQSLPWKPYLKPQNFLKNGHKIENNMFPKLMISTFSASAHHLTQGRTFAITLPPHRTTKSRNAIKLVQYDEFITLQITQLHRPRKLASTMARIIQGQQ